MGRKKYEGIKGIISTECGYCGGDEPKCYIQGSLWWRYRTYRGGQSWVWWKRKVIRGHGQFIFELHDSTQVNRQGTYVGIQYRSEIFYNTDEEKQIAEKVLNEVNRKLDGKVSTKVSKEKN